MQNVNHVATARTGLGPITYLKRESQGPSKGVILTLHGAMGGVDQSDILGRTIGPDGYTYIAVSRPGYPGTPFRGENARRPRPTSLPPFWIPSVQTGSSYLPSPAADMPPSILPCAILTAAGRRSCAPPPAEKTWRRCPLDSM